MTRLDDDTWALVQQSVPIVCVDVVPYRLHDDALQVGLIRRPYAGDGEPVWCHLGGRVEHGETTTEAVLRHIVTTVSGAVIAIEQDAQPHHVMQWFPQPREGCSDYGTDPRKHAVSLCWALPLGDSLQAEPAGEGDDFSWFTTDLDGARPLWPGTETLVARTLGGAGLNQTSGGRSEDE